MALLMVRLELVFREAAQNRSSKGAKESMADLMTANGTSKTASDSTAYPTLALGLWLAIFVVLWSTLQFSNLE